VEVDNSDSNEGSTEQALRTRNAVSVLLVGGESDRAEELRETLEASRAMAFLFTHAERLSAAVDVLDSTAVDVMLLLVSKEDEDGLGLLAQARIRAPDLPIVILSENDDENEALQALRIGARGYLLQSEVNTRLLVTTLTAALGSHKTIAQLNQARERARHMATHDQLTGLPNRILFNDRLNQSVATARRNGQKLAVLFLDLDGFKTVNDTLGHAVGDGLLRAIAGHLTDGLRGSDTAARLGGDEFGMLLTNLSGELDAANVAGKILDALAKPMILRNRSILTTASIGIATYPRNGTEPEELVKKADTAMYHAKERGRNRYKFYTSDMNATVLRRVALESRLRTAAEDGGLRLYYQPQFDLRRERMVGAEALLRWKHPKLGLLAPQEFLPLAEESGFILSIGEWVLRTACKQNAEWQNLGHPGFRVAVNVSAQQFQEPNFVSVVCDALEESGLAPELLELEITESILVQDAEVTVNVMDSLKRLGVHLAIDDFGTGYSALSYLKHLPIDVLKIDQSFVRSLHTDPADATIVETIVRMAKGLNLSTVAEGVENREQLLLLGSYGCHRMQGFLFGKPAPPDVFLDFIAQPGIHWQKSGDASTSDE
jgi:diguanylate cyclase (GGDEF)-like protein